MLLPLWFLISHVAISTLRVKRQRSTSPVQLRPGVFSRMAESSIRFEYEFETGYKNHDRHLYACSRAPPAVRFGVTWLWILLIFQRCCSRCKGVPRENHLNARATSARSFSFLKLISKTVGDEQQQSNRFLIVFIGIFSPKSSFCLLSRIRNRIDMTCSSWLYTSSHTLSGQAIFVFSHQLETLPVATARLIFYPVLLRAVQVCN